MIATVAALRCWPARRWLTALGAGVVLAVLVAIPTDLIDTPLFWREIPPTWWTWPSLLVSAALAGMLVASYVAAPRRATRSEERRTTLGGWAGGMLTFFAVGCPVCNTLVLLALGSAGALTWFEPVQPVLQLVAVALLAWALRVRLSSELSCPLHTDREEVHA